MIGLTLADPDPTQPEAARAAMLASLASVDLVTMFAEDTPGPLIAALGLDMTAASGG